MVIHSNIVALNTRLSTRYVRRHPSEKINTKSHLKSFLDTSESHETSANFPFQIAFGSFLTGRRGMLVIPRNHLVSDVFILGFSSECNLEIGN